MYMTILSGQVAKPNWARLEETYEHTFKHPHENILASYLIHSHDETGLWQIITIWRSKEAYEQARAAKQTQICEQMFCDAGAIPQRIGFTVVECYQRV